MSSSLLFAFAALATTLHLYESVEPHMGTLFRIKLYATDQPQAERAFRAAFARIAQLDDELSDYKPDSEVNRLARAAAGTPQPASADLLRVVETAQKLSAETDGAFDITIGPLTHLWRQARKQNQPPTAAAIAEAKAKCGFRKLHADTFARTLQFDEGGMQLDAGAIAKGDAADQALAVLQDRGIRSALVAASGDLAFSDAPPNEPGWKIGIDSLDSARAPFTRILLLSNGAVSTSGASEQHLDANGRRYSHIIDPRDGTGLTRNITVSVVARRGIDADSLATAVSIIGPKRGLALIESQPEAAGLIVHNDSGQPAVLESQRFGALIKQP
jgi:thiamine biosynthesis lipoprotein